MGDYDQQYGKETEEELDQLRVGSDLVESPENVQAQETEKKKEKKGFFGFLRGKSKKAEKKEEADEGKGEGAETGLETGDDSQEDKDLEDEREGEGEEEQEKKDDDELAVVDDQENVLKDVDEDDKEETEEVGGEGEEAAVEEEKPKEAAAKPKWWVFRRGASKKKTESVKAEEQDEDGKEQDLDQQETSEEKDKEEELDEEKEHREDGLRLLGTSSENEDAIFESTKAESKNDLDEDITNGNGQTEDGEGEGEEREGEDQDEDIVTRTESKRSTGGGFFSGMRKMFSRKKKLSEEDDAKEGEEESGSGEEKDATESEEDGMNIEATEEGLNGEAEREEDDGNVLAEPHKEEIEEAEAKKELEQAKQIKDFKEEDDEQLAGESGESELYSPGGEHEEQGKDEEEEEFGSYSSHSFQFGAASEIEKDKDEEEDAKDEEEDKDEDKGNGDDGIEVTSAEETEGLGLNKEKDDVEEEENDGLSTNGLEQPGAPMNFELDSLRSPENEEKTTENEKEEDGNIESSYLLASGNTDMLGESTVLDGERTEMHTGEDEELDRTSIDEKEAVNLDETHKDDEAINQQEDDGALQRDGDGENAEVETSFEEGEDSAKEKGAIAGFLSQTKETGAEELGDDEGEDGEDDDARQEQLEQDQLKEQQLEEDHIKNEEAMTREEDGEYNEDGEEQDEDLRKEETAQEGNSGLDELEAIGKAGATAGLATHLAKFAPIANDTEDKEEETGEDDVSIQGEDEGEDAKKQDELETVTPAPVELDQELSTTNEEDGNEEDGLKENVQDGEDGEGSALQLEDGSQDGEARGVAGGEGTEETGEDSDEVGEEQDAQETTEQSGENTQSPGGFFPQAFGIFGSRSTEEESKDGEVKEEEEEESSIESSEEEGGEEDSAKTEIEDGLENEGTAALTAVENVGGEAGEVETNGEVEEGTLTRVKNYLASFCAPSTTTTGNGEQEELDDDETEKTETVGKEENLEKALELEKAAALEEQELETAQEEESHKQESVTPPGAAKEYEMLVGSRGDGFNKRFSKRALSETVETFEEVGTDIGLKLWRLENVRDEGGISVNWINLPEDTHGDFYSGDCYLILNTYVKGQSNKLCYDIHFWLGQDSTMDEQFVAAKQAVELDDKLKGVAVQHREVEYNESKLFQSYFKSIRHMKGGYDSGFNRVPHDENMNYKRFYLIKQKKKTLHMYEVDPVVSNMNHGDVFVLDLGNRVYVWFGDESSPKERFTGSIVATNIVLGRSGFAKKFTIADEKFWSSLGATDEKDVPTDSASVKETLENIEEKSFGTAELYRISDASGKLEFTHMRYEGRLGNNLDSTDVFLVHTAVGIYLWEGTHATANEKESSFAIALDFIKSRNLSEKLPITKIKEGQGNALFEEVMKYNRNEAEALKEETRKKLEGFKSRNLNIKVFEDFSKDHRGVEREVAEDFVAELKSQNYVGNESKEEPMP